MQFDDSLVGVDADDSVTYELGRGSLDFVAGDRHLLLYGGVADAAMRLVEDEVVVGGGDSRQVGVVPLFRFETLNRASTGVAGAKHDYLLGQTSL